MISLMKILSWMIYILRYCIFEFAISWMGRFYIIVEWRFLLFFNLIVFFIFVYFYLWMGFCVFSFLYFAKILHNNFQLLQWLLFLIRWKFSRIFIFIQGLFKVLIYIDERLTPYNLIILLSFLEWIVKIWYSTIIWIKKIEL